MSLRKAVENGPRMTAARTARIEARIRLYEAKERKARDQSAAYRRRATGDGPLAKYRKIQADGMANVADQHRAEVNRLRTDLAKAKADEAAKHVKHVKRTVASTAAEGLTPNAAGQGGPPSRAKPTGQAKPAKPIAGPRGRRQKRANLRDELSVPDSWPDQPGPAGADDIPFRPVSAPTKGTPAMTVSGEAVNIEQTRAMLAQIKTQVGDLRGSMEGASGSLASGGLSKLAGAFASADDPLDSVLKELETADKHLSDQETIAEAAQAAGEMHGDKSFYGA